MLNAQDFKTIHYQPTEVMLSDISSTSKPQITASTYKLYQIDIDLLKSQLIGIAQREDDSKGFTAMISFPHPDGSIHEYQALGNRTLSKGLAAKFPAINTYDAVDHKGSKLKWDITPKGLHVMIFEPDGSTIFIDPLFKDDKVHHLVYYKEDFTTDKLMSCAFNMDDNKLNPLELPVSGTNKTFGTCELRTYRLALAATGEYTAFHGGTLGDAQAAEATSMNRVNGVFERDMAITMTIIPNNNLIIYTNAGSDPYSNGNPGTMINQNQSNCDAEIGNGNYDVGHVFGTNSGGLAGLGVVCNNSNKARGVTGSSAPVGDPFDIDYVAHEMGHQFGANHTQNNNCNRNNATAVEPGSASTIMGYAGICSPNVQSNSDDHFHGISMQEIGNEILSGGHTCEVITPLANGQPSIISTNGNITLPIGTPFALTAVVTDPDGDPVSYCWEQIDNGISTQSPLSANTLGPNFRSNSPTLSPTRYFPNLPAVTAGVSPTWEVIPTVSRTMDFRVTVRDQGLNVPGCNDHEDLTVTFDGASGPFILTYPSVTGIVWTALTTETVTWDVANTDNAPVNCSNVNILLSTDGGLTYPTILANAVANDGSQNVTVPSVATTTARVMVVNSNGSFFDISDNNFEIDVPFVCTDPSLPVVNGTISICNGGSTTLNVSSGSLNDATDWEWYSTSCGSNSLGAGTSITVNPSATTSYYVRGEGGCVSPGACTEVMVQVNPLYNLNEAASICGGESYTYPDGAIGTITESHTSNLNSVFGCDSNITTNLTVFPSYNSTESVTICDGDTYTFPDGITDGTAQVYTSSLLTLNNCDSIIQTTLTVNTVSTDSVNAFICQGETYTFPDSTSSSVAQTHTSVLIDLNSCDSTIITTLIVTAVDVSVSLISGGLEANFAGATYQWIDCDNGDAEILGETSQVFTPTIATGNYAVLVSQAGCTDTSACYLIDQTTIKNLTDVHVKIYPNPSAEFVTIEWDGDIHEISLTDTRGRVIYNVDSQGFNEVKIDLSIHAGGVYFIHFYTPQGRIVKDLIKL